MLICPTIRDSLLVNLTVRAYKANTCVAVKAKSRAAVKAATAYLDPPFPELSRSRISVRHQ